MPLVIIGVLLAAAKVAGLGPVADWAWWWVLMPFAGAAVWWAVADATGITQRRAMRKMDERKAQRRERAMADLGLDTRRQDQARKSQATSQRRADTVSSAAGSRSGAPKEPRL